MKKVYLIDVSRRLLIFVLLLGGYITQAIAKMSCLIMKEPVRQMQNS